MNPHSVTAFCREIAHSRLHAREEDRNLGMLDRTGIEEGSHEVDLVEPALEFQSLARLPSTPDRPQREYHLSHAGDWRLPLHPETPLDVALHLTAQTEAPSPSRKVLDVPGGVGQRHRTSRERERDRCS